MKIRIILALFFASLYLSSSAQLSLNRAYVKNMKIAPKEALSKAIKQGEFKDEIFEVTEVPEKWKNESIVVLAHKYKYLGDVNPWNNVSYYKYQVRVRFKLQDLSAVENFSTYYFDNDEVIEITIEKPDGTRNKINLNDAIAVNEEATVPYFGKINVSRTKKIAFENLEPNDIVDVVSMQSVYGMRNLFHWTDPLTIWWPYTFIKVAAGTAFNISFPYTAETAQIILNDDYPTVARKIEFDLHKNFILNFRSLNDAPQLEEGKSKRRRRKLYTFTDGEREKVKDEVWSEPIASLPTIKYQIDFLNNRSKRKTDKLVQKGTNLKTEVTEKDIRKIAFKFIKKSKESTGNIYYDFYKKEGKKISNDREFIDAFYNYYRATKLYTVARYSKNPPYDAHINNGDYVQYMIKILKKRSIPFKVIAGVPRQNGGFEGLIDQNDIIWGVKVFYKNDEVIYTDCDLYAEPGDVNPIFEGIKLYEITPSWYKGGLRVEESEIVVSYPTKNQFYYKIIAEFQDDLDTVKVQRTTHLTGMARYRHKYETFPYNKYYDKLREQLKYKYNFISSGVYDEDLLDDKNFLAEEDERLTNSVLDRRGKFVKMNNKKGLKRDYLVTSYDKMEVKQDGLSMENPDIIFEEEYHLRDLMDEVGNGNYILKVGEFIDGQIEIKDKEERERQTDIDFPYPRSYKYEIEIKLPAYLTPVDFESLNRNVENEIGNFRSKVQLQGNTLYLTVEKNYKGMYHSKEKWEQVLKFVDEAVDFRSAKVILKTK